MATETIDMTPTWSQIVPAFVAALQHGTGDGPRAAREELARMAEAADLWNAHASGMIETINALLRRVGHSPEDMKVAADARAVLAKLGA